ncbi:MAG: hypothetical protein AB8B89_08610 [Gammaproteobacteria bacterium]
MNESLYQHVHSSLQYQRDEVLDKFVEALKFEYKQSLVAIIFYGSCMRSRVYQDAMLDFYVIVDKYQHAYANRWYSIANKILPPNVFYLQVDVGDEIYRSKYAVVSQSELSSAVEKSFHPYFWARFTQPLSYIYMVNYDVKNWVAEVQCAAATTFVASIKNNFEGRFTSEELWIEGLQLTYSAELRAESKQRASVIYSSQRDFYDGITASLFPSMLSDLPIKRAKIITAIKWKARAILGKVLSVLRLMKATTTFVNGVDYIAWKIERHTGEKVVVSEKLRKYPLIYCWPLLLRLYKQGKIR